jgi:hypothetical protein
MKTTQRSRRSHAQSDVPLHRAHLAIPEVGYMRRSFDGLAAIAQNVPSLPAGGER